METVIAGFFRLLEVRAAEAAAHPDAFERLRAGTLTGALLHGALAADEAAALVERLERHDPPFLKTLFPGPFRSWFYGRCLDLTHPELTAYFEEARSFREHLAALCRPALDERVGALLAALDRGRPFLAPPGRAPGEQYMWTTLRGHAPGGFIPPHCEDEQLARAPYHHLRPLVEPHVLSFVLALSAAEAGGALEVFDLRHDRLGPEHMRAGRTSVDGLVEGCASASFRLAPGDLIVFDGGRHLHRLTEIEGARVRWTASSFMAWRRDGGGTYCWG